MRRLKAFGMRTDRDHMRFFPKNHTKGMVVDNHTVMLGSQNLTGGGTGPNRDASLIIRNARANAYFAEIFLHDWTQYGDHRPAPDRESVRPLRISRAGARTEAPQGYVALSLGEFLGEG
jgi:phosphatidylserine/phosphatidylglycerophosphate/cardiolipin synthase-like enzyme